MAPRRYLVRSVAARSRLYSGKHFGLCHHVESGHGTLQSRNASQFNVTAESWWTRALRDISEAGAPSDSQMCLPSAGSKIHWRRLLESIQRSPWQENEREAKTKIKAVVVEANCGVHSRYSSKSKNSSLQHLSVSRLQVFRRLISKPLPCNSHVHAA